MLAAKAADAESTFLRLRAFRWRHGEFDGKLEEILFLPDAVGMGGDGAFLNSAS